MTQANRLQAASPVKPTLLFALLPHSTTAFSSSSSSYTSSVSSYLSNLLNNHLASKHEPPLLLSTLSTLRVRELKYRLTRRHGYTPEELAKILDKKELMETLAYEEHKLYQKVVWEEKRRLGIRGVLVALGAVAVVMFWPLLKHVWEVFMVNFVVYVDKKRYECTQCYTLRSYSALLLLLVLFFLDLLSFWLSLSVLLSWVTTSRYFFPMPQFSIRPAAILSGMATGGKGSGTPLDRYGFNVSPMVITWLLKWCKGKVEGWVGRCMKYAYKEQRRAAKNKARGMDGGGGGEEKKKKKHRTPEEKEARRAAKAARRAEKEAARKAAAEAEMEEEARRQGEANSVDVGVEKEETNGMQDDGRGCDEDHYNDVPAATTTRFDNTFTPDADAPENTTRQEEEAASSTYTTEFDELD